MESEDLLRDLNPVSRNGEIRNPKPETRNKFEGPKKNPNPAFLEKLSFVSLEPLAKLLNQEEIVIPGKRSPTRNPGILIDSGFRLPPE